MILGTDYKSKLLEYVNIFKVPPQKNMVIAQKNKVMPQKFY